MKELLFVFLGMYLMFFWIAGLFILNCMNIKSKNKLTILIFLFPIAWPVLSLLGYFKELNEKS